MKPIFLFVVIIIIGAVGIFTYHLGKTAYSRSVSSTSLDSTVASIHSRSMKIEDSLKVLKEKLEVMQKRTKSNDELNVFFETCLQLEMIRNQSGKATSAYKEAKNKLDEYVLSHSDIIRSYNKNGLQVYSVETPSGEVISYED